MSDKAQEFIDAFFVEVRHEIPIEPELDEALTDLGNALLADYNPLCEIAKMQRANSDAEKCFKEFIESHKKGDNNEH